MSSTQQQSDKPNTAAGSPGKQAENPWRRVAEFTALDNSPDAGRLHLCLDGRYISIIRHDRVLYCIDSVCFHAGGPLALGEIEDIDGTACLRCPWHFYVVSLARGEKFYQQAEPGKDGRLHAGNWRSVGQRQRVHEIEARADGGLWVRLNLRGALASDEYSCRAECGSRVQTGALRLVAADRDSSPVRARSVSPMRGTPPRSPRASREAILAEGEDVWPEDLRRTSSPGLQRYSAGPRVNGSSHP